MKKIFEFEEVVTYYHAIEVDVDNEKDFDYFEKYIGCCIDCGEFDNKNDIIAKFCEEFGDDKVTFMEGCPSVEIH